VKVRVLLDGLGGMKAPDKDVDALKAAGGKVESSARRASASSRGSTSAITARRS
jgi:hypothetical protein